MCYFYFCMRQYFRLALKETINFSYRFLTISCGQIKELYITIIFNVIIQFRRTLFTTMLIFLSYNCQRNLCLFLTKLFPSDKYSLPLIDILISFNKYTPFQNRYKYYIIIILKSKNKPYLIKDRVKNIKFPNYIYSKHNNKCINNTQLPCVISGSFNFPLADLFLN